MLAGLVSGLLYWGRMNVYQENMSARAAEIITCEANAPLRSDDAFTREFERCDFDELSRLRNEKYTLPFFIDYIRIPFFLGGIIWAAMRILDFMLGGPVRRAIASHGKRIVRSA